MRCKRVRPTVSKSISATLRPHAAPPCPDKADARKPRRKFSLQFFFAVFDRAGRRADVVEDVLAADARLVVACGTGAKPQLVMFSSLFPDLS